MLGSRIRLIVIAVGCLVAAVVLTGRTLTGLPTRSSLAEHTGDIVEATIVSRRTRRTNHRDVAIRVAGFPDRVTYLDWFPDFERVHRGLRKGRRLTMLTGKRGWLWHAESEGTVIVDYEDVARAVRGNEKWNPAFAVGALALAAFAAWRLRKQW